MAQESPGRIVKQEVDSSGVTITYNLVGDPASGYRILLYLVDESNPGARVQLRRVRGDVGEGKFVGSGRRIYWDRILENVQELEGHSYRFVLGVTLLTPGAQTESEGGIAWYVYAGGAVVAGAAAILLTGGSKDTPPSVTPKTIPEPPSR
jgi:hypothetical protein